MKESHLVRENFKKRKAEIQEKQKEQMAERARIAADKEARRIQTLENCTSDMIESGLWQTEQEVERQVNALKTKTLKVKALKAQLNFRRKVLEQKPTSDDGV
jgi:regulator of protease activity HflC (stomatin/prohibitin superfamily)